MASISLQKLLKPKGELYRNLAELLRPYSSSTAVFNTVILKINSDGQRSYN